MTLDALAFETHFLDHIAPVWTALPAELRGALMVAPELEDRADALGLVADVLDPGPIRATSRYPRPDPGPGPMALVASYGDIKVGRRLGYRRFVFLEHGAGQSYGGDRRNRRHGSYAGGEDREDVPVFLVPNDHSAGRWSAAYPEATVEVVGSPRLDDLPRKARDAEPVVAISFHWDCSLCPETRSAFGHFGAALPELARRFRMIGHAHPRAADWLAKRYRRAGIEFVPSFEEVCRRADVYACDNSSTLFEFAATGRPVVTMNAPGYRRNVSHGLRFWEAATVGVVVDEPASLGDAIAQALEERPEDVEAREAALRIVYPVRTGGAARAAGAIERWMANDGEGARTLEDGRPAA